ncbi:MAG: hypothetical protein IJT18_07855, partial [Oscillospiraceae bacterium]|nr:hypothetical protein [Oscillospiraceae bacterium]
LGESTVAQSRGSVAVGRFTYATTAGQFTCGVYSKGDTNQVFIVGWGNGEGSRKNVFTVSKGGTGVFSYDCLIGTRSLKAVPVVFRVVGFDTYTLFCAAGTTWADVISGAENPEVTIVDTSEGGDPVPWHGRLLSAVGTSVKGKSSFMEAIQTWDLYDGNDIETANAVLTTDAPQDGATYYILTD